MEIKSLGNTDFDTIFEAFSRAFSEYELQLDKMELQAMFKRRGFCADLSFAAFEGDQIVAFTCNGIGIFEGKMMAYDTGTGTLKEFRGKGLATQIFEYSIPYLKEKGITHYLLEVLQHNPKAVSVYRNIGFEVNREFNYFVQDNGLIHTEIKTTELSYEIRPINIAEFDHIVRDFWDFHPSWQNGFESVRRTAETFISFGVFTVSKLIGYSIFDPVSGDITQIAVDPDYRRKGIATALLREMVKLNKNSAVKVINTDVNCVSITDFLKAKNIKLQGTQFEMIRAI